MRIKTTALADGFAEYKTMEGDLVDQVAFAFYGTHDGTTEILYQDNPWLLDQPMTLPPGLTIRLRPKPPTKTSPSQINLWDQPSV